MLFQWLKQERIERAMDLKSIKYAQFEGQSNEWQLPEFPLQKINLIVGKNASGKSKALSIINSLSRLLSSTSNLDYISGNYKAGFCNNEGNFLEYILRYDNTIIVEEKLMIDEELVLERDKEGIGKIKVVEAEIDKIKFQTSENKIAVSAKRDSLQHPFLEELITWGENLRHYAFGSSLGQYRYTAFPEDNVEEKAINPKDTLAVTAIFRDGMEKFGQNFINGIKEDMSVIGFDIDDIEVGPSRHLIFEGPIPLQPVGLILHEHDLKDTTHQDEISQGMFRALSLIIQIRYAQLSNKPNCILVDDIGEGLDFERSTNLIKLSVEKAKEINFQLIMATNDRFVMNNVPLEYWSIIHRIKNRSIVFNQSNSPDVFEKFELTGLNNFDFYSSEYFLDSPGE